MILSVILTSLSDRYGVYENDDTVYHYVAENSDFGRATIHVTTLERFIADSGNYFVLEFPEEHGKPSKVAMLTLAGVKPKIKLELPSIFDYKKSKYKIYSPSETIKRARSRLGESNYNLITNNCEHFAIWCKTGIEESHQINSLLNLINMIYINAFR